MKTCSRLLLALCLLTAPAAFGQLVAGRPVSPDCTWFSLELGRITSLDGMIEETKRAGTDIPGWQTDYASRLETYSLAELGFDEDYPIFGLAMENQWKYLTLRLSGSYIDAEADSVARRDYYIGVGEVEFEGREYENMLIREGNAFDAEIQGGIVAFKALITPCSLVVSNAITITPWVRLGVFGVAGHYEIDAGPAEGVVDYEIPPREFVDGGQGSGWATVAVPNIGGGGEVRICLGENGAGPIDLVLQGDVGFMKYDGDTESLGVDARHSKDLDLDYLDYELRATLEIPTATSTIVFGAGFQHMETDGTSEAKGDTATEKYDKAFDLELDWMVATIGFRF